MISNPFVIGTTVMSPYWDTWYWCFGLARKTFLSTIFLVIMFIHEMRQTWILIIISILFVVAHYNHDYLIGIHDIFALDFQEKHFFPPFSLKSRFIRAMRQTWMLIIVSVLFVMGATIMFSSLGYTILMLWIYMKSFSFHHFPYNQKFIC